MWRYVRYMSSTGCLCGGRRYARGLCKHCYDNARRRLGTIDKYPRTKVAADWTMDQAAQHRLGRQPDRLLAVEWGHEPSGLPAVGCWAEGRQSLPAAHGQPSGVHGVSRSDSG